MATCVNIGRVMIFIIVVLSIADGEKHDIKIVDKPSSYGVMHGYQGGMPAESQADKLKMRVQPSNFSGPDLLKRLVGKCFTLTDENYKYEFCPFSNVTQHEQSLRWNPYSGILGVWQEWEIVNNTFVAMVMREGDKCRNQHRTTKIYFSCGEKNKVLNVSEPSTCNYQMNFSTPYVCHRQSMLVYPTLNSSLQTEWALLKGELQSGGITQKGYRKYVSQIFVKAGYMLSNEAKEKMAAAAEVEEKTKTKESEGQFTDLYTCREEYLKLKKEVEELQELLASKRDTEMEEEQQRYRDMHEDDYAHMMDD